MNFSFIYLLNRAGYRIIEFLRHWFVDSFFKMGYWTVALLEGFDRFFALKITFRKWLTPLYQDYSAMGYVLGFIFRTVRIFFSSFFYAAVILILSALFLAWTLVPVYAAYQIIINIF